MTLQNAFGDIALDSSVQDVATKVQNLVDRSPVNGGGAPYITSAREKFRDAFLAYNTTNNWTTVSTGSGMAIAVDGIANSSRYLKISSGVTPNAETVILSKVKFRAPCSVIVGLTMSQRIANCDAFVEIVEVDSNGDVITDATQSALVFKNARNGASWQFTGVAATTNTTNVRQDGTTALTAAGTYTTTAASGTSPNFIPAGLFEMTLRTRDIQFTSVAVDTNAAKTMTLTRTSRVPNPDSLYALRVRVLNGGTAPASSTDVRIHSVTILDDTRLSVDFGSIAGVNNATNAVPVIVNGTIPVSGTLTSGGTVTNTPVTPTQSFINSTASTNAASIKATSGTVWNIIASNAGAAARYAKFYNLASSPTVGTSVPAFTIAIPANSTIPINGGSNGIRFGTGIALAITAGAADGDTTVVAANEVKIATSYT